MCAKKRSEFWPQRRFCFEFETWRDLFIWLILFLILFTSRIYLDLENILLKKLTLFANDGVPIGLLDASNMGLYFICGNSSGSLFTSLFKFTFIYFDFFFSFFFLHFTNILNRDIAVWHPAISPDSRNNMFVQVGTLWYLLVHRQSLAHGWLRTMMILLISFVIVTHNRTVDPCQFSIGCVAVSNHIHVDVAMYRRGVVPTQMRSWIQRSVVDNLNWALVLLLENITNKDFL